MSISTMMMLMSSLVLYSVKQSPAAAATACASPPANVDNTTLSNADLIRYGLPLRGKMSMAKWKMMIGNSKHRTCLHEAYPKLTQQPANKHAPQSGKSPLAQLYSTSWTGFVADGADGPYYEADAVFYVPTVTALSESQTVWTWVGLGGSIAAPLVQAGVVQSNNDSNYVGPIPNYAFYENTTANGQGTAQVAFCKANGQNYACPIYPGDRMQVQVQNDVGNAEYYYIGNGTRDWYFGLFVSGPNADEGTAEWIVELPYYNCPLADLMKFQPITFYGMGDTETNGTYTGPYWQTNDYFVEHACVSPFPQLSHPGPLIYDTTYGPPDDSNTIYWDA
jgi:hypothetical protein